MVRVALCNSAISRVDRPAALQRAMASVLMLAKSTAWSGALDFPRGASPPAASIGKVPQAPSATWEVLAPSSIYLGVPARVLLAWMYVEFEPPVPSTVSAAPAGGPDRSAR